MVSKSPAHIEAFEVWYFGTRGSMVELSKELAERGIVKIGERALRNWRVDNKWDEHAVQRDADIQARTDEKAVESIAEMNTRHAKSAILAHDACVNFIRRTMKKPFHTKKDAIIGLDKAVIIERTARGEASIIAEQREIETVQDIQVMLDKMSDEKRGEVTKELDNRKKVEVVKETGSAGQEIAVVENGDRDGDRTGDKDKVNAE